MDYKFIERHIKVALTNLKINDDFPFIVEVIKDNKLGDFSSNVCMVTAKKYMMNVAELGKKLRFELAKNSRYYEKIDYVHPGFLNFFLKKSIYKRVIDYYSKTNFAFRKIPKVKREKINIEYVSANPTGFLHLGHVRNGLIGDVVARVLKACGNEVTTEFWINDLGNQVNLFTNSIFVRYLELYKKIVPFSENGYQGKEPYIVAEMLKKKFKKKFVNCEFDWENGIHDKKVNTQIMRFALNSMLNRIKRDLSLIGVKIEVWTSETKLYKTKIFDFIREKYLQNVLYKKDGALWIKSTQGGDDKDRVLLKSNGATTYFLTDIANHYNKLQRGVQKMINVWGADQTGQIKKLRFAIGHFCDEQNQLVVLLYQMVRLIKDGKEVRFSKRKGQTLTIPDLLNFFDPDSIRWLILSQSMSSPIFIDINTQKQQIQKNTVYYVQYAYARVCQIIKKVEKKFQFNECKNFNLLTDIRERNMIIQMLSFETLLHKINHNYEIHLLCNFLNSFAHTLNSWYDDCHVLSEKKQLAEQRYWLMKAVENLIRNVLNLIGIKIQKTMKRLK